MSSMFDADYALDRSASVHKRKRARRIDDRWAARVNIVSLLRC
jgi:hypothetical protein